MSPRSMVLVVACCLFSHSALVGQVTESQSQELFEAARQGDIDRLRAMLERGIDVNSKTRYGATALSFASEQGHLECVKLLVEKGADVNVKDTFYQATPLVWAQQGRHKEIADYLKEHGAELPTFRNTGRKPAEEKEPEEKAVFAPSSAESRLADLRVSGPNWPQFRGNGARGIADGQKPPLNWNVEEGQNVLWKTAIPGLGHSCPVVWGNRVYLTSAISGNEDHSIKIGNYGGVGAVEDDSEHRFMVFCVDKNSGSILWQDEATRRVPKVKRHFKSTHANPTVATNGSHVVAFFGSEGLYCYNAYGQLCWIRDMGLLDSGWFYDKGYQWGFGSSPIIFQDLVIVQCDIQENSFIAAYRLRDGCQVWKTLRDEIPTWSSPTLVQTRTGPTVVTHGTNFARGYDARTGRELWRLGKHSEIVVPTPFVAHDLIFLASGYRPIQPIVAVSPDARGDVTLAEGETSNEAIKWSLPRGGPYMPSPIVYGDYLYTCSNTGLLECIHATTGQQVYRERVAAGGNLSVVGSPVAADGHLYITDETGDTHVIKAGPEFERIAINSIGEYVLSTPAISEGTFFLRAQNHLIALKQQGGTGVVANR